MPITHHCRFLGLHHSPDVAGVNPMAHGRLNVADEEEDLFSCSVHGDVRIGVGVGLDGCGWKKRRTMKKKTHDNKKIQRLLIDH